MSGHDGLEQIRRVCRALDRMGATVNDHCGLHVHHDAGDLTVSQMMRVSALYRVHQEAISSLLAPSRHNNAYAMSEVETVHDAEALRAAPQSNHSSADGCGRAVRLGEEQRALRPSGLPQVRRAPRVPVPASAGPPAVGPHDTRRVLRRAPRCH